MSLKDNAGLVKMYALVDVVDYQKVVTVDVTLGIEEAARIYLNENSITNNSNLIEELIQIQEINTAIIDGITYYYIVDTNNNRYSASIKINKNFLPFMKIDDKISIKYYQDKNIRIITTIN